MANLAFVLTFAAVFLLVLGYAYVRTPSRLQERLAGYAHGRKEVGLPAAKPSYYQRRLRPYAQRLGGRLQRLKRFLQPGNWQQRLVWAGHPAGIRTDQELFGLQVIVGGAAMLLLALIATDLTGIAIMLGGGLMGIFFPLLWVDARATERQRKVNQAVPDALDILTICVQAGLGFDGALAQIVQRTSGPLSEELGRFLHELEVGVPRPDCFNRLLERTNSDELRILIGALVQAQQLGVPIAQTLEEQAGDMRVRRIQRAREQGAKASPKIALITTILVAPAVMCLFLAIVLYNMVGQFTQLFSTR